MSIVKRNDATGWKRGAGDYSKSYPDLSGRGGPDSVRNVSGIVNSVGSRNSGLAAALPKGTGDKDKD